MSPTHVPDTAARAQDRFVPIFHGEWLAGHVNAGVHLEPDEGDVSLAISA